ncbi:MAG: phosphatase PAP2 family protein [Betaproteobacteria bacterium]|jgi:undecaprenyl-diphosphatase
MKKILLLSFLFLNFQASWADSGGFLGIDHKLPLDNSGIWSRDNQKAVELGSAGLLVLGALYEGSESKLGKTYWQSIDAMVSADLTAALAKSVFKRQRPIDGNNPNAFYNNPNDKSFPSGEVTHITAIVTPFILNFKDENSMVWGLAALPAYVGMARLKSQAHWQTDVLAGLALGSGMGYLASNRSNPWSLALLPSGVSVGFKKNFN